MLQLCITLCGPVDCSPPGLSVCGISRQEHWRGLPCPPPGDLPNPGIKLASSVSPALQEVSLPTESPGKPPLNEHMPVNHLMPCCTHTHTHSLMLCACLRTRHQDTGVTKSAWSCPCSQGTDSLVKETKIMQINVSSMECVRKGVFGFFFIFYF